MKLATLDDGSRDGQLLVASRDLSTAHIAHAIAPTLQHALDDWAFLAPQLDDLHQTLNDGRARSAELPETFRHDPLIYQGGSDDFLGPHDDAPFASEDWGIDFEAEVAVVTDDVPMGPLPRNAPATSGC
jgi:fumarylacetoacetate (FAA) hydrolase